MPAPKGNKNAVGNKGGRPAFFDSAEELQLKINEYFKDPPDKRKVVSDGNEFELPIFTVCGLAYFLGFESRQSLYAYEQKLEFSYVIKRARLRIEQMYEQNLQFNNAAGSIFALKNMGWQDKTEVQQNQVIEYKNASRQFPEE
jgi:hypothetical protein